jgi:hypothetical protein
MLGILTAGLILAVVTTLWLTSIRGTSTTTTTNIGTSTSKLFKQFFSNKDRINFNSFHLLKGMKNKKK